MTSHQERTPSIRRLLVPLDGSRLAESVLPWASQLAQVFDAEIVLLHVRERGAPRTIHGELHLQETAEAQEYLDRLIASLPKGARAERHVHTVAEGDVAGSIA
ncbi:MAG: universal stress protein, partial [Chloroflexota bacterium]|nr:universal stress protein [Chloroflexota bacterium]